MALFKNGKPLVGLDVGSSAVRAVELSKSKNGYQITGFAYEPLGPDSVVDGAIMDSRGVSSAIKRILTSGAFKSKRTAASVSGHSVIVKRVVLPVATEQEIGSSIQFDADQYIPFGLSEVNIDYQVVGPSAGDEPGMEVLMVAAKKDKIHNHTNVISMAGRKADVVDIDAFALQNAFEANYSVSPSVAVALLNIGASLMNINITKGGVPLLVRDVPVGGNQYTDILQKELQLSFQEAEDLKLGRNGGNETEMVQPLLQSITDMVITELQKTFEFFRETYPQEKISRVYICGGTARTRGLAEKIQETFDYPTEILDPLKYVTPGPKVDAGKVSSLGPSLAVAIGLALRGFDR